MKIYSVRAMARYLDISERRVRQLRDEGVIQEYDNTRCYELLPTLHAYISYLRKDTPEDTGGLDLNAERAKLAQAKRRGAEYDLLVKEGHLHYAEDIQRVFSGILINFKTRLVTLPSKLAPLLAKKTDKAEIADLLTEAINEALEEMAAPDLSKLAEDSDEESDD